MTSIEIGLIPTQQQGVGLVEVMVALLLLAVAALGYTALQTNALGYTDEAIVRTQAQTLLRDFGERMRTTGTSDATLALYQIYLIAVPATECTNISTKEQCIAHQVANDITELTSQADEMGVKLGMVTCPGTTNNAETKCLIAAWNATTPTQGAEPTDCMDDATGSYKFNADCVYMEAY